MSERKASNAVDIDSIEFEKRFEELSPSEQAWALTVVGSKLEYRRLWHVVAASRAILSRPDPLLTPDSRTLDLLQSALRHRSAMIIADSRSNRTVICARPVPLFQMGMVMLLLLFGALVLLRPRLPEPAPATALVVQPAITDSPRISADYTRNVEHVADETRVELTNVRTRRRIRPVRRSPAPRITAVRLPERAERIVSTPTTSAAGLDNLLVGLANLPPLDTPKRDRSTVEDSALLRYPGPSPRDSF